MTLDRSDPWLDRWLQALREAPAPARVLELGCDTGQDTAWLVGHGFAVVATDLSLEALQACARRVPQASCVQHDLRRPLPFADGAFGAVVASLCLHYFDWATTVAAVGEVRRCLAPGGLLLCRVNSSRDVLHGAGQGVELEPGFYRQDAHYAATKRFFDAAMLDRLFLASDWVERHREEHIIHRYAQPKVAWELAFQRKD